MTACLGPLQGPRVRPVLQTFVFLLGVLRRLGMHAGKDKSKTRRELVYSSSCNLESTPSEDQCVSAGWFCLHRDK